MFGIRFDESISVVGANINKFLNEIIGVNKVAFIYYYNVNWYSFICVVYMDVEVMEYLNICIIMCFYMYMMFFTFFLNFNWFLFSALQNNFIASYLSGDIYIDFLLGIQTLVRIFMSHYHVLIF